MTKYEAAVISAYTGYMLGKFDEFHKYAEEKLGRPIFTHEFADKATFEELRAKAKEDFIKLHVLD